MVLPGGYGHSQVVEVRGDQYSFHQGWIYFGIENGDLLQKGFAEVPDPEVVVLVMRWKCTVPEKSLRMGMKYIEPAILRLPDPYV